MLEALSGLDWSTPVSEVADAIMYDPPVSEWAMLTVFDPLAGLTR